MNVPAKCKELGIEKIIFGPMLREKMARNSAYVLNAIAVHDDLLAVVKLLKALLDVSPSGQGINWEGPIVDNIQAALAKAEGA